MHTAIKRRVFFAASRKAALWTTRIKFSNPAKVPSAIPVNASAITAPKGISVNTTVPATLGARNRKAALFCEVKVRFALGVLRRLLQRQGSIKKSLRFRHNDVEQHPVRQNGLVRSLRQGEDMSPLLAVGNVPAKL